MLHSRQTRVRRPTVAGLFYPAQGAECRALAGSYLQVPGQAGGSRWLGGIVPHAGWVCSGAVAGQTIGALAAGGPADVVVVFGAVHTAGSIDRAVLDTHQRWQLPGGETELQQEIRAKLAERKSLFAVDDRFHAREHAVEVVVPLIQLAWPQANLLPIEVPTIDLAVDVGREAARQLKAAGARFVFLASSDLTHYGPNYAFTPAGLGEAALEWAKNNDRRLLHLVSELAAERIVPEVATYHNACGGGAIAALLGACQELGATSATLLRHTNSYETLQVVAPQAATNAVGYAAVLVG